MCKIMVFGVKSVPAVGAKDTVINMTCLDSDGNYHILFWVSILEIITMFIIKPNFKT